MSTVIKAGQRPEFLRRLAALNLADHLAEAHSTMEVARRHAERVLTDARQEAERLVAESRKSGFEEGFQEGLEKGILEGRDRGEREGGKEAYDSAKARFDQAFEAVESDVRRVLAGLDARKDEWEQAVREDVLDFALALTRKLTFVIGSLHRESARANLERALRHVQQRSSLAIRAHSSDIAHLSEFVPSLSGAVRSSSAANLIADDSLAPGGCVVSTSRTQIDASLETQLDEIVSLLVGRDCGSGAPHHGETPVENHGSQESADA